MILLPHKQAVALLIKFKNVIQQRTGAMKIILLFGYIRNRL